MVARADLRAVLPSASESRLALDLGLDPAAPSKSGRVDHREYNQELYKRRNEVERLFRRSFSRFEKLGVISLGFIVFALIVEAPR